VRFAYGVTGVRVILASTGGAGHFGPLRPFIDALVSRGDELLIVVPPQLEATVSAIGQPFVVSDEPPAEELTALWERFSTASGREAAILGNRELFGRLWTAALLPTAERACREWKPQLVLHEAAEYASAIAAQRCGVAHAQVAISLAEVEAGSLELAAPALAEHEEHIGEQLRVSPYLTRFPASLDPSPYPATERFREPAPLPRTMRVPRFARLRRWLSCPRSTTGSRDSAESRGDGGSRRRRAR